MTDKTDKNATVLRAYRRKRDFAATPEPVGQLAAAGSQLTFVVQKHAARRLHYDFRLEFDGALKSWAVPKGPSLDPNQRRMAVHVEDHPLEYASFEGTIPAGHYGAGEVIVWDRGYWTPVGDAAAGYRDGKLKLMLQGEKLSGGWTLVRMHPRAEERQEAWLLIKERDAAARSQADFDVVTALPDSVLGAGAARRPGEASHAPSTPTMKLPAAATPAESEHTAPHALPTAARPAPLPASLTPALATLVDTQPSGDWIYEIKFDGYRLLARVDSGQVRLLTRNGHDWTARLPALATALAALANRSAPAWLDGEIVVLNAQGVPDFQALQNAFDSGRAALATVRYFVFDLPFFAGHDLRDVPLVERRRLLQALLAEVPAAGVSFSEDFEAGAADLLDTACRMGLEGIIGKRADAPYPRGRSRAWIKLKCQRRQEFVIGGYTDPQGTRAGFGALLLGVYDHDGVLHYAGNVGSGFDAARLASLKARLDALAVDQCPFAERPPNRKVHWVRPQLVAEVAFAEWTQEHRVRQAVFKGLREDKPALAIRREVAGHAQQDHPPRRKEPANSSPPLRITHPERVIDRASGATKGDLVDYYQRVAALMLPHLIGRPLALLRAPDGIDGTMFFQKHADARQLPGIRQLEIARLPGHAAPLGIDSVDALLGAAQMNVIEFHTTNATVPVIDQPDRMIFDLDPGEGVSWQQIVEGTQLVHALLDELGLRCFLKSSGGKGLHVVVPLTPQHDWTAVKDFSHAVVRHLVAHAGGRFVSKSGASNRVGRIFVDYLRNGRAATTVAAFSARARPGMAVSLPLAWATLPELQPRDIATLHSDNTQLEAAAQTWSAYARTRQTLTRAMERLASATVA